MESVDGDDPTSPVGYLLRLYHDATRIEQLLIKIVEAALAPLKAKGRLRIKRAPLMAARAMAKARAAHT